MSNEGKSGLLVGGAIGAALGYLLASKFAAEEERPPIIVRGGSLHFENTTGKRAGKKWKPVSKDDKKWELDDGHGKKVSFFQVYFVPSSASTCLPVEGEEVVVNFASQSDGVDDRQYIITIVDHSPHVIGTHELNLDPDDETRLIASTTGKITTVKVGSTVCTAPTLVYLEPMKKRNNP